MKQFTSDQHLGHSNILHLGQGRPFKDLAHMHSIIIRNWWECIHPDDEVYFLGDIAMGNFEETIKMFAALPAKKFLVPGNHDKVFPKLNSKSHIEKFTPLYEDAGFTILPLWHELNINVDSKETPVLLSHVPYAEEEFEGKHRDKLAFARPPDKGLPLIHGHTHLRKIFNKNPREYHVGVDAHDFKPVPETQIADWLRVLV